MQRPVQLMEHGTPFGGQFVDNHQRSPQFSSNVYNQLQPMTTRNESIDSVEILTDVNNRNQNSEHETAPKQPRSENPANPNQDITSRDLVCNARNKLNQNIDKSVYSGSVIKEEQQSVYVPNGIMHSWPATSTPMASIPSQSFFDGTSLSSIPHNMAVNPSSPFDFSIWGGCHFPQHPAAGQFYNHHFSNPYHNFQQRTAGIHQDGHPSMVHQQHVPQSSPATEQASAQHSQHQAPVSPIIAYAVQPNVSPNGVAGGNMHATVPPPAPSSSSHSSDSVNSPPPSSLSAIQAALMDQHMVFYPPQGYQQENPFGAVHSNSFDGYTRMASYSPQDQQLAYAYNQSYHPNSSVVSTPNTDLPSSSEGQQFTGRSGNSPTSTTALHMPTPPGETTDSVCKVESASPENGTTKLIPLTIVRDYSNVTQHQRTQIGANMTSRNGLPLQQNDMNFNSEQVQTFNAIDSNGSNCIVSFNLPLTPPPNAFAKKCQCQNDCKC